MLHGAAAPCRRRSSVQALAPAVLHARALLHLSGPPNARCFLTETIVRKVRSQRRTSQSVHTRVRRTSTTHSAPAACKGVLEPYTLVLILNASRAAVRCDLASSESESSIRLAKRSSCLCWLARSAAVCSAGRQVSQKACTSQRRLRLAAQLLPLWRWRHFGRRTQRGDQREQLVVLVSRSPGARRSARQLVASSTLKRAACEPPGLNLQCASTCRVVAAGCAVKRVA